MKLSKSKLALAKVINENGGWADDSAYAANDEGGIICGYSSKPIRNKMASYSWCGSQRNTWIRGIKTPQWHQCVISREEYYHAYPNADADGWIEWKGGECPVDFNDEVDVTLRLSVGGAQCKAGDVRWSHLDLDSDIIAYRQHKPEVKPEFCESVTRSIPEPAEKPTIEQLAQDYRNKLDFANRKQREADDAKVAADAALGELELAGEALGLLIAIAKQEPEPELVITDWRDLMVGDEIRVIKFERDSYEKERSKEIVDADSCVVVRVDPVEIEVKEKSLGKVRGWSLNGEVKADWEFIRRP